MIAATVAGWVSAAAAGALALTLRQVLARRMEAMARACHELRGPLTAARLGLQLGADVGGVSVARLRAIDLELGRAALSLDDLQCAGHRPLRVHAKSARPAPRRLQAVDVRALLCDAVEAWHATAESQGIELRMRWSGPPVHVWGDRFRLAQATGNLIANAIEHGASPVSVVGQADGRSVRIEVSDGGQGLPAPVSQLASRARAGRGRRGRGLAIASAVADSHGGRLAAAPSERGARLVLELPARAGRPAQAPVAG